jgi:hypothetical protein
MKTSVPDHSGKLVDQVADDMGLTHTSTRRSREDRQRMSPRGQRGGTPARQRTGIAAAVHPSQPASQATNYNPEDVI